MARPTAAYWIEKFQMTRHIEGGSYKELYRAPYILGEEILPDEFHGDRHVSTSIYFLLEAGQFSALHRIPSDEVWHFYYGDPLIVYEIEEDGKLIEHTLGSNPENGESFQCVVKAGNWFGSRVAKGSEYSLVGCTVSPGFDFADFELAKKEELVSLYPQHTELISQLTHAG